MKITFMGTGAAEGWPAAFCKCEYCTKAWELGGRNIRKRSCTMVDDKILVDIGPDLLSHVHKHKLDLSLLDGILITHSHEDHLYPLNIGVANPPFATFDKKIKIYANKKSMAKIAPEVKPGGNFELIEVKPFEKFTIGDYTIHPMLATHADDDENAIFYVIEKDGKTFLNGNDTGVFPPETWEYLRKLKLDYVSLDTTMGGFDMREVTWTSHMNVEQVGNVKEELMEMGIASERTRFVMNHFSHNGGLLHHELEHEGEKIGVAVAYDGLITEV